MTNLAIHFVDANKCCYVLFFGLYSKTLYKIKTAITGNIMKKLLLASVVGGAMALTGCAAPYSSGLIYSDMSAPNQVTDNSANCSKMGDSTMVNILGFLATGDASVTKAKKKAGISKVANVDYDYTSILGIINTTTTRVCGN